MKGLGALLPLTRLSPVSPPELNLPPVLDARGRGDPGRLDALCSRCYAGVAEGARRFSNCIFLWYPGCYPVTIYDHRAVPAMNGITNAMNAWVYRQLLLPTMLLPGCSITVPVTEDKLRSPCFATTPPLAGLPIGLTDAQTGRKYITCPQYRWQ